MKVGKAYHYQGSHSHWKTWKNERSFSSQEKSGNFKILPKSQGILYESGKSQGKLDQKIKKIFYGESLKSVLSRHIFIED